MAELKLKLSSKYVSTIFPNAKLELDGSVETKDSKGAAFLQRIVDTAADYMKLQIAAFEGKLKALDAAYDKFLDEGTKTQDAAKRKELAAGMKKLSQTTETELKVLAATAQQELPKKVAEKIKELAKDDRALSVDKFKTVAKVTLKIGVAAAATTAGITAAGASVAATVVSFGAASPTILAGVGAGVGGIIASLKLIAGSVKEIKVAMQSERSVRGDIAKTLVNVGGQMLDQQRAAGKDQGKLAKLKAAFKTNHSKKCKELLVKHDLKLTSLRQKTESMGKQVQKICEAQDKITEIVSKKENQGKLDPKKKAEFNKKLKNLEDKLKALMTKAGDANDDYNNFKAWNEATKTELDAAEKSLPPAGFGSKALAGAAQLWKAAEPLVDISGQALNAASSLLQV